MLILKDLQQPQWIENKAPNGEGTSPGISYESQNKGVIKFAIRNSLILKDANDHARRSWLTTPEKQKCGSAAAACGIDGFSYLCL